MGLLGEETGGKYLSYHFDYRGSTVALTAGEGQVVSRFGYEPYGGLLSHDASIASVTPFLFNGQYGVMTDTNGLYQMRARFYHPELRRFVNQDPVFLGGIAESQSLNRFAFVTGEPVSLVDPWGLTANCPLTPPLKSDPNWKDYDGYPQVFHCDYDTYLENRKPTPANPIAECVYDRQHKLVDENHRYAGCRGTPDQYLSSDTLGHVILDTGGVAAYGIEAFITSRKRDFDGLLILCVLGLDRIITDSKAGDAFMNSDLGALPELVNNQEVLLEDN